MASSDKLRQNDVKILHDQTKKAAERNTFD